MSNRKQSGDEAQKGEVVEPREGEALGASAGLSSFPNTNSLPFLWQTDAADPREAARSPLPAGGGSDGSGGDGRVHPLSGRPYLG